MGYFDQISLSVRSRKVSKPRDWYLKLSYRFEIWQAHRQHCWSACQISERSDNSKYKSRAFETLRDLTERRLFGYWDGAQEATSLNISLASKPLNSSKVCHSRFIQGWLSGCNTLSDHENVPLSVAGYWYLIIWSDIFRHWNDDLTCKQQHLVSLRKTTGRWRTLKPSQHKPWPLIFVKRANYIPESMENSALDSKSISPHSM